MLKTLLGKRVLHERPDLQIVDFEQKITPAYEIVRDDLKRLFQLKPPSKYRHALLFSLSYR